MVARAPDRHEEVNAPDRLRASIRALERAYFPVELAHMNARDEILVRIEDALRKIEEGGRELAEGLLPGAAPVRPLTMPQKIESLVYALGEIAKQYGAIRLPPDSLHAAVVAHAPEMDQFYWHGQILGQVNGILRTESALIEMLATRGVLVWEGEVAGARDSVWRLIDTHRFSAHQDIYDWMTGLWEGGRRCRACGLEEDPKSATALVAIEQTRRHGQTVLEDGTVVLPVGGLIHPQCRPRWVDMLRIASSYSTREQAVAADQLADRKPLAVTAPALIELVEPMRELPPTEFPTSALSDWHGEDAAT